MISPLALAGLLVTCAPNAHPETIAAIVHHESGGYQFAIGDNDSHPHRAYFPATAEEAGTIAIRLIDAGHSIDMGLGQINSSNLPGLHRAGILPGNSEQAWVADVFQECPNIRSADYILTSAWSTAVNYFGASYAAKHPHSVVLNAISDYNSNKLFFSSEYVAQVVGETQSDYVRTTVREAYRLSSQGYYAPVTASAPVATVQHAQPTPGPNAWVQAFFGGRGSRKTVPARRAIVPYSYHPPHGGTP